MIFHLPWIRVVVGSYMILNRFNCMNLDMMNKHANNDNKDDSKNNDDNKEPPKMNKEIQITWENQAVELIRDQMMRRTMEMVPEQEQEQQQALSLQTRINQIVDDARGASTASTSTRPPTTTSHTPFMVAIVGIPGAGKSTSTEILAQLLHDQGCMVMPFDGYHYPMSLPDATDRIYRRGAPDTFDVTSLYHDLNRIRSSSTTEPIITLPGFDHAKGDPENDIHTFQRNQHHIVLCEGLYLLHNEEDNDDDDNVNDHGNTSNSNYNNNKPIQWGDIASCFDLSIYIDADLDTCMERLKVRNLCIPGYTPDEIQIRVDQVDRINAILVQKSKHRANFIVQSVSASSSFRIE